MGRGGFTSSDWSEYKTAKKVDYATKVDDIYRSGASDVNTDWLPYNVVRESCDSEEHPNSTPIIIGLDTTGSMNSLVTRAAKGVGDTMIQIIERECVPHPQILFSAIDDYITSGNKCIQVTQFESDIRIAKQMYDLSFIGRGGGNDWESYADLWYFAANHTKCDAIAKGRKGVIITVGDDGLQPEISRSEISTVFGDKISEPINVNALLSKVNRGWEVFHISCERGGSYTSEVKRQWDNALGNHHIVLEDITKICEVIVSLLQTIKGDSVDKIADSWDSSTSLVVKNALAGLAVNNSNSSEVVVF